MIVLFESCLVCDCDLITSHELSRFIVLGMTQYVAPWWDLLGIPGWGVIR